MSTEEERLRKELRAMGAVNRQLQAQLDEPATAVKQRRATHAGEWIDTLAAKGVAEAALVRGPDGKVYLVEGDDKRPVNSGILAAALETSIGATREVSAAELDRWTDSVPVELFEAPDGPPFVVVGGTRRRVHGIPLPHPVTNKQASEFAPGDEVNVTTATVSRARFNQVSSPKFQVERLRGSVKRRGVVGTGRTIVDRATRRLRRS